MYEDLNLNELEKKSIETIRNFIDFSQFRNTLDLCVASIQKTKHTMKCLAFAGIEIILKLQGPTIRFNQDVILQGRLIKNGFVRLLPERQVSSKWASVEVYEYHSDKKNPFSFTTKLIGKYSDLSAEDCYKLFEVLSHKILLTFGEK